MSIEHLAPHIRKGAWRDRAACVGADPDLFFPSDYYPANTKEALAYCRACDVRQDCLNDALDRGETDHGLWGGLTPSQRVRIVRSRR